MNIDELTLDGPQPMPNFAEYPNLVKLTWHDCGYENVAQVLSNPVLARQLTSLDISRSDCDLKHALLFKTFQTISNNLYLFFEKLINVNVKGAVFLDEQFWDWFISCVLGHIHTDGYVNISCTGLKRLRISRLPRIRHLDVSHNFISEIHPQTIKQLERNTTLKFLDISYNDLHDSEVRKLIPFTNKITMIVNPQPMHYLHDDTREAFVYRVRESGDVKELEEKHDMESNVFNSEISIRNAAKYVDIPKIKQLDTLYIDLEEPKKFWKYIQNDTMTRIYIYIYENISLTTRLGRQLSMLPNLRDITLSILAKKIYPKNMANFLMPLLKSDNIRYIEGDFRPKHFTPSEIKNLQKALLKNESIEDIASYDGDKKSIFDDFESHFIQIRERKRRLQQIIPIVAALQLTRNERKELNQIIMQTSPPTYSDVIIRNMPQISAFMGDEPLTNINYPTAMRQYAQIASQVYPYPSEKRKLDTKELPFAFETPVTLIEGGQLLKRFTKPIGAIEWIIRRGDKSKTYGIQTQLDTYDYQFVDNKWQRTANIMIE